MIIAYNKLVRDRIPEIIEKDGKTCVCRKITNRTELIKLLEEKLLEELDEFRSAHNRDELADILEVVFALADNLDISINSLLEARQTKAAKRGGFTKGLFLETVQE